MLPRNYVLDMERNERRRLLRYVAILTKVPCAPPDDLTQILVHTKRIAWRGNAEPLPA